MSEIMEETLEDLRSIKGMTEEVILAILTHPHIAVVNRAAELPTEECIVMKYICPLLKTGWVKEIKS